MVGHRGHRAGAGVDVVSARLAQVLADQSVHVTVEGGAEQQPLAAGRQLVEQGVDGREEPQVAQVVGLVEDSHLHVVGGQRAPVDQVLQPPGVATTMSVPWRSCWIWRSYRVPP